jgi:hypothetical protein
MPPVINNVVFDCTGNAPAGIDITYGSDSSHNQGSPLPFHAALPLDTKAMYYSIFAQLQGGGDVICTVTVNCGYAALGQLTTTKSGRASGGYNIADPQVCSDFRGAWQAC